MVNIIQFVTFSAGNMWNSPVKPKEQTLNWNQEEERDTTRNRESNVCQQWISVEKDKALWFIRSVSTNSFLLSLTFYKKRMGSQGIWVFMRCDDTEYREAKDKSPWMHSNQEAELGKKLSLTPCKAQINCKSIYYLCCSPSSTFNNLLAAHLELKYD